MAKKKEIVLWKGNDRVQTNGTEWQIREQMTDYIDDTLEDHIKKMQLTLQEHPDAYVSLEECGDGYSSDTVRRFTIRWWTKVEATHPQVVKYLAAQEGAEKLRKEHEDMAIARLRASRPELFK